jgi:transposase-like protein
MSSHRYTPEFKDEAVRPIVDRGYSVTEVSEWLRAVPSRITARPCHLEIMY